jgi:hypothetical protein
MNYIFHNFTEEEFNIYNGVNVFFNFNNYIRTQERYKKFKLNKDQIFNEVFNNFIVHFNTSKIKLRSNYYANEGILSEKLEKNFSSFKAIRENIENYKKYIIAASLNNFINDVFFEWFHKINKEFTQGVNIQMNENYLGKNINYLYDLNDLNYFVKNINCNEYNSFSNIYYNAKISGFGSFYSKISISLPELISYDKQNSSIFKRNDFYIQYIGKIEEDNLKIRLKIIPYKKWCYIPFDNIIEKLSSISIDDIDKEISNENYFSLNIKINLETSVLKSFMELIDEEKLFFENPDMIQDYKEIQEFFYELKKELNEVFKENYILQKIKKDIEKINFNKLIFKNKKIKI